MNPLISQSTLAYDSFIVIYPYLVQYNLATKQIEPEFATSWQTSANGLTWTFHTEGWREVVGWHTAHHGRRRVDPEHDCQVSEGPDRAGCVEHPRHDRRHRNLADDA